MIQETNSVLQFSFFILFALLGTVVSIRLRQPYVVGLLIFGMLAGPQALGLVTDSGLIATFSELGAILLLFAVGIEFSISRIIKSSFRAVFITAFKMAVLFIVGYEAALYFGLDLTSALFVGAMLSITSTAILFKIVAQKGMQKNRMMPLLFSMLIVEDIVAVAALTFFSSLGGGAASLTYEDKVYSVLVSLGLLGAFYLIIRRPAANAIVRMTSTLSGEVMIFVSFSLCLAMSMVASFIGLSPAIGAFLAGSIVSSLPNSRRIEREIKPLLLMFASLFFLSLGMQIDPVVVLANIPFAAVLTALFLLVCVLSVYSLLFITGSGSQNALFGASAMAVMGEFSLLIASLAKDEHGPLLIAAGSFGVIATSIVSSFLLDRQHALIEIGHRNIPGALQGAARSLSQYFKGILRDFSPSGRFWRASKVCWGCARSKLSKIALIGILVVLARIATGLAGFTGQLRSELGASILILGAIPAAYYLFGLFRDIMPLLDALSRSIARHGKGARDESIILRDLAIALCFIIASITLPELVEFLRIPGIFGFADELFFIFSLVFLWDVYRHARNLRTKRRG